MRKAKQRPSYFFCTDQVVCFSVYVNFHIPFALSSLSIEVEVTLVFKSVKQKT